MRFPALLLAASFVTAAEKPPAAMAKK